jgi:ribonuclease D
VNLPKPELITTESALWSFVDRLKDEPQLSVDTESNSLHAYQEQVCLIQFSVPTADFLVDSILLENLDPLAPVFASDKIEKIFHAAEYDLICLKRDFGYQFSNLFDTQIAARILGWKRVGLGSILEDQFNVRMNKKFQRANWKERPLSSEMMLYAQLDTHFLIRLRDLLEKSLMNNSLYDLAAEDFRRICDVNGSSPTPKEGMCWKVNGAHELTPQQMAVLQELCLYRDKVAARLDRPLFKVVSDRTLVEISRHCPFDYSDLGQINGVHHWLVRKHGREILAAVNQGLKSDPIEPQNNKRPGAAFFNRMDAVHTWRKVTARGLGVESDIVLPRDLMEAIVKNNPGSEAALSEILVTVPWRMNRFGKDILEVLERTNHRK